MELTVSARLWLLVISAFWAWILPELATWPPRCRSATNLKSFQAAHRSERWFGWEPDTATKWAVRVPIVTLGAVLAMPGVLHL